MDNQIQQQHFYSNMPPKQINFNPHHQQQQQQHQIPPPMMMMLHKPTNENYSSNSLIIRKVPKDLNTEEKMREHFQQFGKIINILTSYNNYPDAALVQFSTHQEALAAYKCPQPVFNNRFIRLYWLNQQQQQQIPHPQQQKWTVPQTSSINTATSSDSNEPTIKKHVKERLDFNNISAIQLQQQQLQLQQQKLTSYNEQYNKENKVIVKESKVHNMFNNKKTSLEDLFFL
jgi:RNA-binding protein 26